MVWVVSQDPWSLGAFQEFQGLLALLLALPFTISWKFMMVGVCGKDEGGVHSRKETQNPSHDCPQEKSCQTTSNMHETWQDKLRDAKKFVQIPAN